ncbi:MAG: substrate-binding domain-containing protein, partial [Bacteroidales bacterium]
ALYPMVVKWAEEFKKIHPNVRIDISGGGAGKGMTDALAKVVDLGMVSREIHNVEKSKGAIGIAVVKDAVVPTINTKNPLINIIKKKGLSRKNAIKIWNSEFKTWGEILGTNSRIPVHVFTRSDACGAAETWAAWFGKRQEDLEGTAVFGDPGVASAVQKDKIAIGYNNIAYAYDQKTKLPYSGMAVFPIDVNNNGVIDKDENFYANSTMLINAIVKGKYPSPPARNLYLVSNGTPKKPEVVEFIKYILTKGQQYTLETGYIPLSKVLIQQELTKLKKK